MACRMTRRASELLNKVKKIWVNTMLLNERYSPIVCDCTFP